MYNEIVRSNIRCDESSDALAIIIKITVETLTFRKDALKFEQIQSNEAIIM